MSPSEPLMPPDPSSSGSRWGRRSRAEGSGIPWIPIIGLVVVVGGAAGWWFGLREAPEVAVEPTAPPAESTTPASSGVDDAPPPLDLPALAESDGIVRRVVGAISSHPRWAEWLVTDELALRFVSSVVNVAAGQSPSGQVPFLAPEGDFSVASSGEGTFIDPASYQRYDPLVDAFVSFDTGAAVELYRQLAPLFDEAHRSLGFPEDTFGEVFAVALDRMIDVPVPDLPPEVELDLQTYLLVDPALEDLSPAEKHMLRLGPMNGRRVQERLVDLRAGLLRVGAIQR